MPRIRTTLTVNQEAIDVLEFQRHKHGIPYAATLARALLTGMRPVLTQAERRELAKLRRARK